MTVSTLDHINLAAHVYEKNYRVTDEEPRAIVDGTGVILDEEGEPGGGESDVNPEEILGWNYVSRTEIEAETQSQVPFYSLWDEPNVSPDAAGFFANTYEKELSSEIVIAFRGTQPSDPRDINDILTDLGLFLGAPSNQFLYGYYYVKSVIDYAESKYGAGNYSLSFTGQSLGGALATVFSAYFDVPTEVFNPALSQDVITELADGETFSNAADVGDLLDAYGLTMPPDLSVYSYGDRPFASEGHDEFVVRVFSSGGPIYNALVIEVPPVVAGSESNVTAYVARGEVLTTSLGIDVGPDFGSVSYLEVGEPAAMGSWDLHGVDFVALMMTLPEVGGEYPMVKLVRDIPKLGGTLLGKSFFDQEIWDDGAATFLGVQKATEGQTIMRELVRQHNRHQTLGQPSLLTQVAADLTKLAQDGPVKSDPLLQQILTELVLQDAWRQLGFMTEPASAASISGQSALGESDDWVVFDIKALSDVGQVPAQSAIDGLLTALFEHNEASVIFVTTPPEALAIAVADDFSGTIQGLDDRVNLVIGIGKDVTLQGGSMSDYLISDYGHEGFSFPGFNVPVAELGSSNETLIGGAGEDYLVGGDGEDVLIGGASATTDDGVKDEFWGGLGKDTFHVGGGDIIHDPDYGTYLGLPTSHDRVKWEDKFLSGGPEDDNVAGVFNGQYGEQYREVGDNLEITLPNGGGTVTIENWDAASAHAGITLGSAPVDPSNFASPLVLDLDGDGIELVSLQESGAFFDIDRDGFAERIGWVLPDDGLLAIDANSDGTINDVSELFGAGFVAPSVSLSEKLPGDASGFAVLAQYDSNQDGIISSGDTSFADLLVWKDANGDGFSEAEELFTLTDLGIASIDLDWLQVDQTSAGNIIKDTSTFDFQDTSSGEISDVWFLYDPNDTRELFGGTAIDPAILALPNLPGSGEISSLHVAMSRDPLLQEMVEELVDFGVTDLPAWLEKSKALINRWLEIDDIGDERLGDLFNQRLAGVEKLFGFEYLQWGRKSVV